MLGRIHAMPGTCWASTAREVAGSADAGTWHGQIRLSRLTECG
jgi:hypothetical protein